MTGSEDLISWVLKTISESLGPSYIITSRAKGQRLLGRKLKLSFGDSKASLLTHRVLWGYPGTKSKGWEHFVTEIKKRSCFII